MYQAIQIRLSWCRVPALLLYSNALGSALDAQRNLKAARRPHTAGVGSTTISARR